MIVVALQISPPFKKTMDMYFTFRLNFEAFNNIIEYKALVLKLETALDLCAHYILIYFDS